MREKDVRELVDENEKNHVALCHSTAAKKTVASSDEETINTWCGAYTCPVFVSPETAIRAILDHLNLELHVEPSKPESVVAIKKKAKV